MALLFWSHHRAYFCLQHFSSTSFARWLSLMGLGFARVTFDPNWLTAHRFGWYPLAWLLWVVVALARKPSTKIEVKMSSKLSCLSLPSSSGFIADANDRPCHNLHLIYGLLVPSSLRLPAPVNQGVRLSSGHLHVDKSRHRTQHTKEYKMSQFESEDNSGNPWGAIVIGTALLLLAWYLYSKIGANSHLIGKAAVANAGTGSQVTYRSILAFRSLLSHPRGSANKSQQVSYAFPDADQMPEFPSGASGTTDPQAQILLTKFHYAPQPNWGST